MSEIAKRQFVRQQGFGDAPPASCAYQYSGLMFQPRLLAAIVLLAILLQSAAMCLVLAGILWWNVLVPQRNPFDALYNRTIAAPRNLPRSPRHQRRAALPRGWPGRSSAGPGSRYSPDGLALPGSSRDGCGRPRRSSAGPLLPRLVSLSSPARRDQLRQPYSPVESRGVRARDSVRRESQPSREAAAAPRAMQRDRPERAPGSRSGRRVLERSEKRRFVAGAGLRASSGRRIAQAAQADFRAQAHAEGQWPAFLGPLDPSRRLSPGGEDARLRDAASSTHPVDVTARDAAHPWLTARAVGRLRPEALPEPNPRGPCP